MKRLPALLLFCAVAVAAFATETFAQNDTRTLRHYRPERVDDGFAYDMPAHALQVARFDNPEPGFLRALTLYCAGSEGDTARLHFLGHAGGTSFPQVVKDLVEPIPIVKQTGGIEPVTIFFEDYQEEPVRADNNQFFIGVSHVSGDFRLLLDEGPIEYSCESSSGGNYGFVYFNQTPGWPLRNGANQVLWGGGRGAYCIDAFVEPDTAEQKYFEEITQSAGIDPGLSNRSMAFEDYDGDGWLDFLVAGRLYRNTGGETFEDVTAAAGLTDTAGALLNPRMNGFADFDADGDLDIIFISIGNQEQSTWLFRNDGEGVFAPELLEIIPPVVAGSSFSIADYNEDGFLDLFIGQLWSTYPDPEKNYLFLNTNGEGFEDESFKINAGLFGHRRSRGSVFVDYDADGDQDLFVTNYFLEQDELWRNNGERFDQVARENNIDIAGSGASHGTGVDFGDYDADGDLDILLPQLAHPDFMRQYGHRGTTIYQNQGGPDYSFRDLNPDNEWNVAGIEYEETHAGATWGDVNNDGLLDFYITTYYGCRYVDVYVQQPDHTFKLQSFDFGLHNIVSGEDGVWADFNNDGKLDLAGGSGNRVRLYLNTGPWDDQNYVQIELAQNDGNQRAIGATVRVHAGDYVIADFAHAGRGQRMQRASRLHFGLGDRTAVDSVVVTWPGEGKPQTVHYDLQLNERNLLRREDGLPTARPQANAFALNVTAHPNPAQDVVRFTVAGAPDATLEIFTATGAKVTELYADGTTGQTTLNWKLDDAANRRVPAGVYFYKIKSSSGAANGKIVVAR